MKLSFFSMMNREIKWFFTDKKGKLEFKKEKNEATNIFANSNNCTLRYKFESFIIQNGQFFKLFISKIRLNDAT